MGQIAVGVNLPNLFVHQPLDKDYLFDYARRAEAFGFDSLVVGDHLVWHAPVLDPLITLGAVGSITSRIKLIVGVYLLALRHPVPVAKAIATVAHFAPGRFIFGVGVGGENPVEWEACGVPTTSRGARTNEAIRLVQHLCSGEPAPHSGKQFSVPAVEMKPRLTEPVPIWVGGRSEDAMRRAAALGDGWFPHNLTPARYQEMTRQLAEIRHEGGPTGGPVTRAFSLPIVIGTDRDRAFQMADTHVRRLYKLGADRFERYFALGPVDSCCKMIEEYLAAGVEHLVLQPLGPDPGAQMELLGKEVLPRIRGR